MKECTDQIVCYNTKQAFVYYDMNDSTKLAEIRDVFIEELYKMLKNENLKNMFIKEDQHIEIKIKIQQDTIKVTY